MIFWCEKNIIIIIVLSITASIDKHLMHFKLRWRLKVENLGAPGITIICSWKTVYRNRYPSFVFTQKTLRTPRRIIRNGGNQKNTHKLDSVVCHLTKGLNNKSTQYNYFRKSACLSVIHRKTGMDKINPKMLYMHPKIHQAISFAIQRKSSLKKTLQRIWWACIPKSYSKS